MEERAVKVWYDREADYLEVIFDVKEGFFRETDNPCVMEKIDSEGRVIGFSVFSVSSLSENPLSLVLSGRKAA